MVEFNAHSAIFRGGRATDLRGLGRRGGWGVLVLWMLLVICGCRTPAQTRGADIETKPPIQASSAEAQQRFDQTMDLLQAGEYARAGEAFRLIQMEFTGDPVANLAEVYVARAAMGKIDLTSTLQAGKAGGYAGSAEALQILQALRQDESVDDRIRYGAAAYFALEWALRGKLDQAFDALATYPGASLSHVVLAEDRLAVRALLLEGFWRAGRWSDTLEAAARLHEAAAEALGEPAGSSGAVIDEEGVAATPTERSLGGLQALARDRAFAVAEKPGDAHSLQDYLRSESAFLRAVAGWQVLEQSLAADLSEKERAGLEDLFNQIAPDLVAVSATSRAAELSQRLAAVGGTQRLAIGFLLPLSGSHRAMGQRAMAGALVAMRAFHQDGAPEVTLVFEDSQGDPAQTFERLVRQKVLAVVGPLDTRRARAFAPLAQTHQIPLITLTTESVRPSAAPADADAGGSYVFRNFIDAAAEARAQARVAFDRLGDRRAAVVFPQVGYGEVTSRAFVAEFRGLGGQVVAEIPYDRSATDFSKVARQLAKSGAQAVFVPDSAEKVAELSAFFANENIWGLPADQAVPAKSQRKLVHYLGTSLWENPMLVRQAASYVEGAIIPVWFSGALKQSAAAQFSQRFEAVYGHVPGDYEAFSYDTVGWLRDLMLKRGMRRPVAIRDALLAGDVYQGVSGEAQMDAQGEGQRVLRFVTPTADGFVPLSLRARTASPALDDAPQVDGQVPPVSL